MPLMKSMTHYSESLHQNASIYVQNAPKSLAAGAPPHGWGSAPDPAGGTYMPLMKSMTHYSESLHQMLPFMSKMHQNRRRLGLRPRPRWGSLQRSPGPLAVKGWDGDLVTSLVGVDFDMCPLACDRCPPAVSRLATGLLVWRTSILCVGLVLEIESID